MAGKCNLRTSSLTFLGKDYLMRHYTKILGWENKRRLNKLIEFRDFVLTYFNNSRVEWMLDPRIEEVAAQEARFDINLSLKEVHSIILQSGITPTLSWVLPSAGGRYSTNVDLIENIFNLHEFQLDPRFVLDCIDMAIGIYASNAKWARMRIFNPFYYIGLGLDFISDLPFIALGKLGLNRQKARSSVIGRIVKGVLYLITVLAAFLTILHLLGFLDPVKQSVHELLGTKNAN